MGKTTSCLDDIRRGITDIDQRLIKLLAKRREFSLEVAKYKVEANKPIRDLEREQTLLHALIQIGESEQLEEQYITKIFHAIIEDSVLHQQRYLQRLNNADNPLPITTVAFLGDIGSYSYLAAKGFFARRHTKQQPVHCVSFKQVLEQVGIGHADFGVLPIENTSSGSINEVYDLLQQTPLAIVGEITQPIEHELLVAMDTELDEIKTIYSHPQPYQQCSEFLRSLNAVSVKSCASSIEAIAKVATLASKEVAAIGCIQSGEIYGLRSLKKGIANQIENYTRFIIVARKAIDVSALVLAKTTFIMSTPQHTGALVDCLLVLKKYSINMTKLESRPVIGRPWEEMFYVDVESNVRSKEMQLALAELQLVTQYIKVLGCYPMENVQQVAI